MNISFLDFWPGFQINNNFFKHTLNEIKENVIITNPENADLIIYSCFGNSHKRYNCKKIFYTGENIRPNFEECDISLSFDFDDYDGKNIRLPLWLLQIDWYNKISFTNPKFMIPYDQIYKNKFYDKPKDNFCCIVFNSPAPHRYEILEKLSKYKRIDCFGLPFGNWFDGEDIKLDIISNYKFNICFENSIYPGYYTEKPIHAKVAGCVPVYWSDSNISNDFNEKSFINLSNFNNLDDLVEYIIEVDKNDEKYNQIRNERLFNDDQDPKIIFDKIKEKISNIL